MAYLDTHGLNTFWTKLKGRFQDKLVSGTNIKTVNSQSLLGSGDISTEEISDAEIHAITAGDGSGASYTLNANGVGIEIGGNS